MKGLCQKCLGSNVDVKVNEGKTICFNCLKEKNEN
jgi:formylmethanofuran dehydrogenase subunit E